MINLLSQKSSRKLNYMLLKDFKYSFIVVFCCIVLCYFLLSFFVVGYDEGINTSKTAVICNTVMKLLTFSLEFWAELKFSGIIAILLCFLTTTLIISFPLVIIKNLRSFLEQKNKH